jgi:sigma-B regulation protein RsbU (phosphoserine phosphatase)
MLTQSPHPSANRVSKQVSLRFLLVVPFILQIFAAVGLTGWLSLRNGQKAVDDLATQLRNEVTARIHQHIETYMATPHLINQINADAIRQGLLNLEDSKSMERYFWHQSRLFDGVSTIAFANERGEFVGANGLEDYIVIANQSTGGAIRRYAADNQGKRTKSLSNRPNYDARKRSWYQTAVRAGNPIWAEISVSASSQRLDIGAVYPFYDKTGTFKGVLLCEHVLSAIGNFLASLKIGRSGQAFILERSGELVASSTLNQPYILSGSEPKRIEALDSDDVLVRATARHIGEKFGSFTQINSSQHLTFALDGQRQLVQVTPFKDRFGLDWLIVVVVPEADFMQRINDNTRTTILLCVGALAGATVLGILTARSIIQPILRLSEASRGIARRKLDQTVATEGIEELRVLAQSFNHMAVQLRESFSALEKANAELEQRVEQRTADLKEANQEITLLNHRLKAENVRMSAELEVTRRLQQMLLPKPLELQSIDGLEIAGFMEPASEVGGDYYDVLQHDGQIKICIGDVTGHGLESGVLMIMVQTAVRTLLENGETDYRKFLDVLNRTIYKNVQRMNSDKNLTLSLLDYQPGQLRLSGQHEEIIVVRSSGTVERIDTIDLGFPIGLEADIADFVAQTSVHLHPDDVVVLYTDGITEAENTAGGHYGIDRLCEVVRLHWQQSATQIKQAIINDLRRHIGEQNLFDDITLLVLKQK